jgi:hypothetical protein
MAKSSDVDAIVRKAREPVRTAIFAGLFGVSVIGAAAFAPALGIIGAIALGFTLGGGLTIAYKLTTRTPKALSAAYTAGATACRKCGSMQTDQSYTRGPNDTEVLQWTCYACNHRWLAEG